MATTATITPTLGSAPVTLQAGNYSAIDDRRFWGSGVREGVLNGGSYQVIQRAAGANMTVDVASSVGAGAIVQGDSVTAQGNYFVPPATNVNVDIAAADATNPRNDLVVLEVKDDQHDAGGLNIARVRVITGTANASAAATDAPGANGTPALPSSCLLLALVRVTAAATTVTTAMINDRRPWSGGAPTFETSLPSPAVDGQEIYYRADSTNGRIWHLRYRNAFNGGSATYPWEYIGGSALTASVKDGTITDSEGTTSTTYAALTTAGPTVTLPLAGDYEVTIGFTGYNGNTGAITTMSYDIGTPPPGSGTAAVDADAVQNYQSSLASAVNIVSAGSRTRVKTGLSAVALTAKYKVNAGTGSYWNRFMIVRPIRVG